MPEAKGAVGSFAPQESGLRGVAAKGEVGSFVPADIGLSGVEAKADLELDSLTLTGHAMTMSVEQAQAVDIASTIVIPALWNTSHGVEIFQRLDGLEANLKVVRALAERLQAGSAASAPSNTIAGLAHNNPPPEIVMDVLTVDIAIAAIPVLRKQMVEREPDPDLLDLIWRAIEGAARMMAKLCAWFGKFGREHGEKYIDNIFDCATKSFGKTVGVGLGAATIGAAIYLIAEATNTDLDTLVAITQKVLSALKP